MKNNDVAREFVCKREAKSGNMFTDGKTIWGYGRHHPVAHWLGFSKVLFNTDGYSVSTARHKSYVRGQLSSMSRSIQVYECNTKEIVDAVENQDQVVVLTKYKELEYLSDIMEALKNYCKSKGVKRFPKNKFEDEINKLCLVEAI